MDRFYECVIDDKFAARLAGSLFKFVSEEEYPAVAQMVEDVVKRFAQKQKGLKNPVFVVTEKDILGVVESVLGRDGKKDVPRNVLKDAFVSFKNAVLNSPEKNGETVAAECSFYKGLAGKRGWIPKSPFEEQGVEPCEEGALTVGEVNEKMIDIVSDDDKALGEMRKIEACVYPILKVPRTARKRTASMEAADVPVAKMSKAEPEETGPSILAMASHPVRSVLAVLRSDFSVSLFDITHSTWSPLILSSQKHEGAFGIAFQPNAGMSLSVITPSCVVLWNLEFDVPEKLELQDGIPVECPIAKPAKAYSRILRSSGFENVTSMSWNPTGTLLAVSSRTSGVMVWDTIRMIPTLISKMGITSLSWSPKTGNYLVAAPAKTKEFWVWQTDSWELSQWKTEDYVNGGCWNKEGTHLMIKMKDVPIVRMLFSKGRGAVLDEAGFIAFPVCMSSSDENLCGSIRDFAWDGQRLVVSFEESPFIGVLKTSIQPNGVKPMFVQNTHNVQKHS